MTQTEAVAFANRLLAAYRYYQNIIRDTVSMPNKDQWLAEPYPWYFGETSLVSYHFPRWIAAMTPEALYDLVGAVREYTPEMVDFARIQFGLIVPELSQDLLQPFTD